MFHHHMSFYWDTNVGEFLFPGLNINGASGLALLAIVLILFAVAYEALKVIQTQARARAARERLRSASCAISETATLLVNDRNRERTQPTFSRKMARISCQALLFLFHTTLGYIVMLSVMVYNGYVFIFVILGLGLGYFLFGHISMKVNMENIRARTTRVMCSPRCPNEPTTSGLEITTRTGYVNEVTISSNDNSSSSTETSHVAINDVQSFDPQTENIIYSCRL